MDSPGFFGFTYINTCVSQLVKIRVGLTFQSGASLSYMDA